MHLPHFLYSGRSQAQPQPATPALDICDLHVAYPGIDHLALNGVNLRVPIGARVALVGPNGSGKSTLLKAAAGLLPFRSGDIRVFGQPVGALRARVAYLPQRGELDWRFPISVRRLVVTGRYVHLGWLQRPGREDYARADAMLARLGLAALAERQISQLSGGQQQRALLARALTQDADLLLLDEPLNAVDAETREVIAQVLETLRDEGKTYVIATHDLGRLEADFDNALYLSAGRVCPPPPGSFHRTQDLPEAAWIG